jgi:hypothetical protein
MHQDGYIGGEDRMALEFWRPLILLDPKFLRSHDARGRYDRRSLLMQKR